MKLANLVGERFKERPADCSIDSQALMVRGGYIKYVANGIYSSFMPMKRITKKIENIIRQEMDAIDGREISRWLCPLRCGRNREDIKAWAASLSALPTATMVSMYWA